MDLATPIRNLQPEMSMEQKSQVATSAIIINTALIGGLATFALVAIFLFQPDVDPSAEEPPLMTLMAAGFVASAVLGSFVVSRRSQRRTIQGLVTGELIPDENSKVTTLENVLGGRYMLEMVMGTALLQGAGLFAIVAMMIEGHWLALVLIAIVLTVMAAKFSTPSRISGWIAKVQREADDIGGFNA